ncbi:MAG: heparinase II/III family protein [Alphaproteobacteria bacterium]|nr:heparinase II/III family protein [Alphaproteobacteria bacterium]
MIGLPGLAGRRLFSAGFSRRTGRVRSLTLTPRDLWPGVSSRGQELLNDGGQLAAVLEARPEDNAALLLHRFGWLRHLRAIGGDQGRREARRLVLLWLDAHRNGRSKVWRADIAGARLYAWLGSFEFFAASAGDLFRAQIVESIALHIRLLMRGIESAPEGAPRLAALTGALAAAIAFGQHTGALLRRIERMLDEQFFADGFHRSRNPVAQLSALRRLIEIQSLLHAAGIAPPERLAGTVRDAGPALAFFRHGDKRLACFHGGHESESVLVDLALARVDRHTRPPTRSIEAGYDRLQAGRTLVLVDSGLPTAKGFDLGGHSSPLAMEFSDGKQRIVVNCGAPADGSRPWNELARATAAHSTLTVDDVHALEIEEGGGVRAGGLNVEARLAEAEGGLWLDLSHDGYAAPFGLIHRRRLYITHQGGDLRGEDLLEGGAGWPFSLRFHLHPDIEARLESGVAQLTLPGRQHWSFRASGGRLSLANSIYLGEGRPRDTTALLMEGLTGAEGAAMKWAFRAVGRGG